MSTKYELLQTQLRILREQRHLSPAGSDREKSLDLDICGTEEMIDRIEADARDLAEAMRENS